MSEKIVKINYSAYFADTDKLFDTTVADVAKENDVFDEKNVYEPLPYIVGSQKLYKPIDEAITGAKIGEEFTVTVPVEEAAGVRDPKLIELYPIKDFYKQEINPYPGMPVRLGNRTGTVHSVGAGRVRVDFNSPLAGHDLLYKVTVTEEIVDDTEKAKAIVSFAYGKTEGFQFSFPGDKVVVTLPEDVKFDEKWNVARFSIVFELRKVFGVNTVEYVEVWSVPATKE